MTQFKLIKKLKNGVRIGELQTPHGLIQTPFFMPVGTVGSVKGISPEELRDLGAEIILCNTYHLFLRPGEQTVKELGGLHEFMRWNGPILTDSGGYQVFSLSDRGEGKESMVKITEDGVEFKSHLDGSTHFFTPEKVIQIQLDLGVDILMPLDYCPNGKADTKELRRSVELTIKWAERAKRYFDDQIQNRESGIGNQEGGKNLIPNSKFLIRPQLHGIVQGGLDPELRRECAKELVGMDFDGYSVGGLAVDMETRDMWQTVKLMGEILPEDKQRYLMGVGTPEDIIKATQLGMDMFDCVLPTRLARHGSVYAKSESRRVGESERNGASSTDSHAYELTNLLNSQYRTDRGVLEENCGCPSCRGGFSKAYIAHLLRSKEILGLRLATLHNLSKYLDLIRQIRSAAN